MSAQRGRSATDADYRSALPSVDGVPWWGAIVLAVTAAAVGFAFDAGSGNEELTVVFSAMYIIGCVAAVLAVRQVSLFTAVVQPPLILFVVVPGAYWLFNGAGFPGVKEIAINCGYPLIERFPLMLACSVIVLVIGLVRWYFGLAARKSTRSADDAADDATESPGRLTGLAAKFRRPADDDEDDEDEIPRRPAADRPRTSTTRSARADRPAKRPAPTRSRHTRPPLPTDAPEPAAERPRRTRRPDPAAAEYADPDLRDARRRPRASSTREPREPRDTREPRERREPRRTDLPPLDRESGRRERVEAADYEARPRRRRPRPEGYEPYEPPTFDTSTPPRRRPTTNGSSGTHHPFSNVRYRGAEDGDTHVEHRSKHRARHSRDDDSWRYNS